MIVVFVSNATVLSVEVFGVVVTLDVVMVFHNLSSVVIIIGLVMVPRVVCVLVLSHHITSRQQQQSDGGFNTFQNATSSWSPRISPMPQSNHLMIFSY